MLAKLRARAPKTMGGIATRRVPLLYFLLVILLEVF